MKPYEIKSHGDTAEVLLYGDIGPSPWGEGIDAKQFAEDLAALKVDSIVARINSAGGDVFHGAAIHNALKRHKAEVHVVIDGLAASAASGIAMAGDTIEMAANALLMIHNPWTIALGDAGELREVADTLDKVKDTSVTTYHDRTGIDREKLSQWMDDETWFTAEEAETEGFIDRISDRPAVAASVAPERFTNTPASLLATRKPPIAGIALWRLPAARRRVEVMRHRLALDKSRSGR